ncbi:hypothetical protein [Arachnia propionica]|uniref:DUF2567 domain-containing protein n=1 Tax=Arachnia propionica TaxID=1750 RepID=A0A3P1WT96_9ACTN|nr:hypothetical protein [Arachnia propionica]RRD49839.1 hypothetical protein EII35_06695 [Arachnia propionica]
MSESLPTRARPAWTWSALWFTVFVLGISALAAGAWAVFAHRPSYVVTEELGAYLSERGQADVFSSDALYVGLAALCGLLTGVVAWVKFRDTGWLVCVQAILGGFAAALVIWQLGMLFSPDDFDQRLATAVAGDRVPIDLALHSLAALLVGPFGAITPVMFFAAFWPENPSTSRSAPEARRIATVD